MSSLSDQVAETFCQQVIDIKNTILVLQIFRTPVLLSLTEINQICLSMNHQIYLQIILRVNRNIYYFTERQFNLPIPINYKASTNTDPHCSKALPSKVDYENGQLILYLDHMMSCSIY
jgi:hypothetical protein